MLNLVKSSFEHEVIMVSEIENWKTSEKNIFILKHVRMNTTDVALGSFHTMVDKHHNMCLDHLRCSNLYKHSLE